MNRLLDLLTPLIRLGNLFPDRAVYAKCEFLAASGSFKIRGANHLLDYLLRANGPRLLVVPSMGNTVLGAAVAAPVHGFSVVGVVPKTISRAKDEKLQVCAGQSHPTVSSVRPVRLRRVAVRE